MSAVLDATMDLFAETGAPPTPEAVADRSGISLSSVYRYFDTPDDMYQLAAERQVAKIQHLAAIGNIGEGPLADRIDRYVDNRLKLHEVAAPVGRAWIRLAQRNPDVAERRDTALAALRAQTLQHFAPEFDAMDPDRHLMVSATIDTMFQVSSLDHCLDHFGADLATMGGVYRQLLHELLG